MTFPVGIFYMVVDINLLLYFSYRNWINEDKICNYKGSWNKWKTIFSLLLYLFNELDKTKGLEIIIKYTDYRTLQNTEPQSANFLS